MTSTLSDVVRFARRRHAALFVPLPAYPVIPDYVIERICLADNPARLAYWYCVLVLRRASPLLEGVIVREPTLVRRYQRRFGVKIR